MRGRWWRRSSSSRPCRPTRRPRCGGRGARCRRRRVNVASGGGVSPVRVTRPAAPTRRADGPLLACELVQRHRRDGGRQGAGREFAHPVPRGVSLGQQVIDGECSVAASSRSRSTVTGRGRPSRRASRRGRPSPARSRPCMPTESRPSRSRCTSRSAAACLSGSASAAPNSLDRSILKSPAPSPSAPAMAGVLWPGNTIAFAGQTRLHAGQPFLQLSCCSTSTSPPSSTP